ncbi:MAG: hypothetical protein ABJH05_10910 [Fulvivirga sp.]
MQNVVHEYFKKTFDNLTIIVQLNPVNYTGIELTIANGEVEKRKLEFDEDIYEDLKVDGFEQASALEFNLYLKGLTH